MKKNASPYWPWAPLAIVACGTGGAVLLLTARVALMPLLRDVDTGRFATNIPAMVFVAVVMAAMMVFAFFTARDRVDVPTSRAIPTGLSAILAGGVLGLVTLVDGLRYFFFKILPPPGQMQMSILTQILLFGLLAFGVLGAVALVRWGLQTVAQSGTHCGMSAYGALAPVMWVWFRLAWYEMSYASTVGWPEKFYDFLMVILELLFLFKLARFVSGVGKTTTGGMLFWAMAAAMFALSGPLARVLLYFTGGAEAYQASALAGVADFGIGVLALVFGWSLYRGYRGDSFVDTEEEELEEDDVPYNPSFDSLLVPEEDGE